MASLVRLRLRPAKRELRVFGLAGALIALVAGALRWHGHPTLESWLTGGGAATLALLALALPAALAPLYVALSVITFPIGWGVSHLLLGALFFGVLTPLGLLMRLFGRDPMRRRRDPSAPSYFSPRAPNRDKRSYFRQY